ncbi:MAG: nucleotidyltransferase domain-containing protein [Arcobacter sp.]|nr:nucleotidyltransferase domain-containing protein [Arcobacter sp.]
MSVNIAKKIDCIQVIMDLKTLNNKYEKNGFKIVSLFGSYARNTNDIFSDIDLTYSIDYDLFSKDNAFLALPKIKIKTNELREK